MAGHRIPRGTPRGIRRGIPQGFLLAAGLMLCGAGPALAQGSCAALVDRFAAEHNLSASPPPVAAPPGTSGSSAVDGALPGGGSGAATPDRLARSGGVVAPPAAGDRAVIEPPRTAAPMPTAPAVRPDAAPNSGSSMEGGSMGQAARNAQIESLVTAARSAAKDGNEPLCMDSLEKARNLTRAAPGTMDGGG
ncbi:hypothetical protein [Azospirillum isscasi]|uniref:Uncharacterized protein n=1 Tax=Azospirillum isscasi TaxID=3053926 RepID=A0ABU0WLX1_9PROT|nr:hypothetical protein [Azospirillum isscasi]MDQ2105190.1 hypothetical protein [Azospirillum isscasi]